MKNKPDFDVLRANYPVFTRLPSHISNYIDQLNEKLKPGEPKNTPCCLQMSEALNACGSEHRIPQRSMRRENAQLPQGSGRFYLQAVDELEAYLKDTYGAGEEIKTNSRNTIAAMKAYLAGKRGILCFRNAGYGAHTELWDKTRIVQNGAPDSNGAAMSQEYIFGQPRVVFWEIGAPNTVGVVPPWLLGWWEVTDIYGNYYYYFFPNGEVCYTKTRPSMPICPVATSDFSGTFSVDASRRITVRWNKGELAVEVYTPLEVSVPPPMAGTYPDYVAPPFMATKMW